MTTEDELRRQVEALRALVRDALDTINPLPVVWNPDRSKGWTEAYPLALLADRLRDGLAAVDSGNPPVRTAVPFDTDALEPAETPNGWRWARADARCPAPCGLPYNLYTRLKALEVLDNQAGFDAPSPYCRYYDSREEALADLRRAVGECRREGADPSR